MEFNTNKYHVMRMGKSLMRPTWNYTIGNEEISESSAEKDLGVIMQNDLSPENHINKLFGNTFGILRNIKVAFNYMDKEMMKKIIMTMIRPKLEYAETVWSPHKKKHIRKLERIQRMATKMVPEIERLTYEERLREMKLPTLEARRERGDLITIYKLVNKLEETDKEDFLLKTERGVGSLRGHTQRLSKGKCLKNTKRYSFPHRSIDTWNGLNEETVSARNVHKFKEILDRYRYEDEDSQVYNRDCRNGDS